MKVYKKFVQERTTADFWLMDLLPHHVRHTTYLWVLFFIFAKDFATYIFIQKYIKLRDYHQSFYFYAILAATRMINQKVCVNSIIFFVQFNDGTQARNKETDTSQYLRLNVRSMGQTGSWTIWPSHEFVAKQKLLYT